MDDINGLKNAVLIIVVAGVILGIGLLILSKLSDVSRDNIVIVNESLTIASGTGTLTYPVVSLSYFGNSTHNGNLTIGTYVNYTDDSAVIVTSGIVANGKYNVSYTGYEENVASESFTNSQSAIDDISTTWLGIIVLVLSASIIIGLIIRSFMFQRR